MKVALGKCLKYLVVDTAATSRYLIDFLKEKGLQRDVLVLENFPAESKDAQRISMQSLKESGGEYIREVIETNRSNGQLQRAVDYFTSGRVVCKDFQTAMKLHRELGCKSIVTFDGTDFKPGMVSGG